MSGRDFIAVDGRRRSSPSSVVAVVVVAVVRDFPFSSKGGTFEKNQIFAVFQKNSQFFWNPRFLAKWVDEILSPSTVIVVVGRRRRRSSPSSVISTFSSKGGTFEKNQIFAVFQKNSQFFWNPRFLAKWVDEILSPSTVVVGRRRRRSSPSSVISTFSSKGGTFEKNQIFAVFQKNSQFFWNPRFLAKWVDEIFSPSTVIVGRRRRRSSPSSVVAVAVVRDFPFSSKGGTFEKNQIFAVFQKNSQFFWNPRFLAKWVDEILSPSTVVVGRRRRRSSPSSVISTFSSKGGTFEKNQIFAVFQKLAIFLKSKIFSKMSGRDFIAVDGRRRSSPSSVVAVVRRFRRRPSFPFFVQGRDLWKKSDFRCFSKKLTIFLKSKIFSKMSGRDFIAVDGRRRSSPSSVVAVIRHFHFFVQGRDLWKKSDFRCFSKILTIFLKSKIFSKMSGRDFIAVDGHRRSSPSSVVAVVRRRRPSFPFFVQGRDLWKKSDFRCFSKKLTIFLKSKIFSKMSGRDFIAVDSCRRSSPSSVVAVVGRQISISLFRPREGPLEKNQIFRCFFKKTHNFSEIQDF